MNEKRASTRIMDEMRPWIENIRMFPGFIEWKRRAIVSTLYHGDIGSENLKSIGDQDHFIFPEYLDKQHNSVMAYFSLSVTQSALADTEYYFRRFPFRNLPISYDQHLRYTCEMFFSRIYEFSERLKRCLNSLNQVIPGRLDVGGLIKSYAKEFRAELKERNLIHHHNHFDDVMIDKIGLLEAIAFGDEHGGIDRGWRREQRAAYREACREWAERARRRSARVGEYLDAVAQVMIDECSFLRNPITLS